MAVKQWEVAGLEGALTRLEVGWILWMREMEESGMILKFLSEGTGWFVQQLAETGASRRNKGCG